MTLNRNYDIIEDKIKQEGNMHKYLSTQEIANILGVSDRMVRKYIKNDGLPAVRLKRRLRIDEEDLNNWLNERKTNKE